MGFFQRLLDADKARFQYFFRLQHQRRIGYRRIGHAPQATFRSVIEKVRMLDQVGIDDAQFLGQFTLSGEAVVLAFEHHAAGRHVPVTGI